MRIVPNIRTKRVRRNVVFRLLPEASFVKFTNTFNSSKLIYESYSVISVSPCRKSVAGLDDQPTNLNRLSVGLFFS